MPSTTVRRISTIRNVINVKCINCTNCIGMLEEYYLCRIEDDINLIEECVANDDNIGCDLYVEDSNDDASA